MQKKSDLGVKEKEIPCKIKITIAYLEKLL